MMIYFHVIDIRSYVVKVFYLGFPLSSILRARSKEFLLTPRCYSAV